MDERDIKNENNREFNDDDDPTKEAFFSDMGNIEEEIASEAIELVRHALSLVETQYYDDAIEILRQALGLYAQINKSEEINALNSKIDEIYLLKEKTFRERELEIGNEIEMAQEEYLLGQSGDEAYKEADSLIVKAIELVNNKQFNAALDVYEDAIKILKTLGKSTELENINELIEDCYNRKADFLRKQKIATNEKTVTTQQEPEGEMSELELKAQKIRVYEEAKRNENEKSNQAYEKIGKATELKRVLQYDESLRLLKESVLLFEEINWINEVKKIENMIEQIEREKERFLFEKQQIKEIEQQELVNKNHIDAQLIERANVEEQIKMQAQAEKLKKQVEKKQEETNFQNEISEMVNHAEMIARKYDLNMKKAVKKGEMVEECAYSTVIKIYEQVKQKVNEKGWKDQVAIYDNQIRHYYDLLEKDDKLREIEAQKIQKQKDFDESLKTREVASIDRKRDDQRAHLKEQISNEAEDREFRKRIENIVKEAEKIAREYDSNFKKAAKSGHLNFDSKYPEVIKIYKEAREEVFAKGWKDQVAIYDNQIRHYYDLLEKDNKLREMESQKIQKQIDFDESLKTMEVTPIDRIRDDQKARFKEQISNEAEDREFRKRIENIVKEAEKIAREYDSNFKKAVKSGNLNFDSKYPEVIKIYNEAREKVLAKGWNEDAVIYSSHIRKYTELFEKEKKVRELESKKDEEEKIYREFKKTKKDSFDVEKLLQVEAQKLKEFDDKKFQDEINNIVNNAEKMARDYDVALKKALKEGTIETTPYLEIIDMYTNLRKQILEKGWTEQGFVYTNQIKFYQEKLEKDKKLREIEDEKALKQEEFENAQRMLKSESPIGINIEKLREFEGLTKPELEEERFEREIDEIVNKAEKMAREYELAIKRKQFDKECPYLEIAEIYKNIREKVYARGWKDESEVYGNQMRLYQEKLEKDKKLREIEDEKAFKQEEFEHAQRILKSEVPIEIDIEKIREFEELTKPELEEERFEREIDEIVNKAEIMAREYKSAIKRRQFDKECPYLEIAEIYKNIREKVYARGWKDESEIYGNQMRIYQKKSEKDKRLRIVESEKIEKQKEFEASLIATKETKQLRYQELEELSRQDRETEVITKKAMDLIGEAENVVRSYELSLKKDILTYKSPYEQAISNYEKAKILFQKIGWKEEAHKLMGTINFYKDKKIKDNNLRELEQQKLEESKQKIEFEKFKDAKSKESEDILNNINRAERLAQDYELKKKEGILNTEAPYDEIITIYKKAKLDFKRIDWLEEASQLDNSLKYYQEKSIADKNLRASEEQKTLKQEAEIKKQKFEAKEAKEAEEELLRLKTQALEVKKRNTMEYESKKDQAFNFMDLAKNELKQNNFEKAVSYYNESEKIFAEIIWPEGIRMIKESINVIKIKKERIEREAKLIEAKKKEKLKLEAQIQEKISKAKDLQDLQQEQRRKEILAIQEEKEREREISEKAYAFLEEGTRLKDKKKFEEAYEKYLLGRDMFKKIGWDHDVSRINNDLLIILKKEMKLTEKLEEYQKKKLEEEKELEELLKDADIKQKELDKQKKEDKRKQREKLIQKEHNAANDIIKTLKYNEGVLALRKIIGKLENTDQDKVIKDLNKQIEVLENASQVPIITNIDLDKDENRDKFKLAYRALDKAQISLSINSFLRAITELNEALYNLKQTKIGIRFISTIEDKVNTYKKELDIKKTPEQKRESLKIEKDDIRSEIAERRAERRRRIKRLMGDDDNDEDNSIN
jgi:hypothetical protein